MTVHCPKCGSEDIRERNVAATDLPVLGWEMCGNEPTPTDYGEDSEPDWDIEDTDNQYVCHACWWEGTTGDLRIEGADDDSDLPEEACEFGTRDKVCVMVRGHAGDHQLALRRHFAEGPDENDAPLA